jgi:hypothetical protein
MSVSFWYRPGVGDVGEVPRGGLSDKSELFTFGPAGKRGCGGRRTADQSRPGELSEGQDRDLKLYTEELQEKKGKKRMGRREGIEAEAILRIEYYSFQDVPYEASKSTSKSKTAGSAAPPHKKTCLDCSGPTLPERCSGQEDTVLGELQEHEHSSLPSSITETERKPLKDAVQPSPCRLPPAQAQKAESPAEETVINIAFLIAGRRLLR